MSHMNKSRKRLAKKAKTNPTNGMVKNEHFSAAKEEMSFDEQYSEVKNTRSREKALLRSVARRSKADKPWITEIAAAAMEELLRMAQAGEPLWIPSTDSGIECLSKDEYLRSFPKGIDLKPTEIKSEASRESAVIIMNRTKLVEILMDVNQWSSVFSSIVSRASTIAVLSTGVAGNYNGALQVMTAEFQVPSPLVPTREYYFVRYCKQHDNRTWAVADVSLDNLGPAFISRSRRRPSGCLIQELPNGFTKVTWVEHVEVDDRAVHNIYTSVVNSGLAFGAKRWVTTLLRQCGRLLSAMADHSQPGKVGEMMNREGGRSLLKLAERMVLGYCTGVGASTAHMWTTYCGNGADDARMMTRKNNIDDRSTHPGIVISAATSFWIPVPPKRVFDFLRDVNSRSKWDILSGEGPVQEKAHIAIGRNPGNCVSLLHVYNSKISQGEMHVLLQESWADSTASYVIYSPVHTLYMNVILFGGNPHCVPLLPCGFAILPDGNVGGNLEAAGSGGSLLTVAFQVLNDTDPTKKLKPDGVATVDSLIKCTVERIKSALLSNSNV